jgi:DNA polymerase elongation subunit (family B)
LPPLVRLEFEGRYAAMLSHEPKNYALLEYGGKLILRGVAFRSSRVEPFGEDFLRRAIACLLRGDVPGVHAAYLDTVAALRSRTLPADQVAARVRLTKTPAQYLKARTSRRETAYEALIAAGRERWERGEHIRVYRATGGRSALLRESKDGADATNAYNASNPRDYDIPHYLRLLRDTFAARLTRAFTPDDFATLFDSPEQLALFATPIESIRPLLTSLMTPPKEREEP